MNLLTYLVTGVVLLLVTWPFVLILGDSLTFCITGEWALPFSWWSPRSALEIASSINTMLILYYCGNK